jgi:hypothetical protein
VGLVGLVVGCGGNTEPDALSMTGTWRQSGDLRDQTNGDSHIHLGTFTLTQSGAGFSGTGQQSGICSAHAVQYTGPLADPTPFAVTNGLLSGRKVTFERDICRYQGTFEAGRNNRITGTATCTYVRNGVTYNFTGQWQADK